MRKRKNARFLALMTAVTMVFGQPSFALPVLAEGETAGEKIASEEIRDDAIAADATITLGAATAVVDASGNNAVKVDTETTAGAAEVKITEAGNYRITGEGSNVYVSVAKSLAEGVTLILDDLTIDDSGLNGKLGTDTSVISCAKGTPLTIVLRGTSVITGSSSYTTEPEAVISVKKDGKLDITGTSGSLTIKDGMSADAAAAAKAAGLDPADGIKMGNDSVGGVFTMASGTLNIDVNGNGIKAKNGRVFFDGGSANLTTVGDGISAKRDFDCEEGYGSVILSEGSVTINSKDDGIQAENIDIRGGELDITTSYENASTSYYTSGSSYVSGKNTIAENGSSKTEYVSADTGSHKALKGGTKAKTYYYGYTIANDNSSSLTEKTTQTASGGIKISGGTINLSTIAAGIKANSEGAQISGYTATNTGVYIIGSPDDAINSNTDIEISGGTITIDSGDDGISAAGTVSITGDDTVVNIKRAYEGIEGKEVVIGTHNSSDGPEVSTFTADDGINTASKTLTYYYESADNEDYNYKKVSTSSSSGNNFYMYSGRLTVKIDGSAQSVTLGGKSISYTPAGDGIDANGTHYIYGGTTRVFTPSTGSNSPLDSNEGWTLYRAATMLAAGTDGMNESVPSKGDAVYITLGGGGNGGPGGGNTFSANSTDLSSETQTDGAPGDGGQGGDMPGGGSQASITAGTLTIKNGETVIYTDELPYAASFLLFASPDLTAGTTYTLSGAYSGTATAVALGGSSDTGTETGIASVRLNKTSMTLSVNGTETLTATVIPNDTTSDKTVTWTSDNTSVATVSSTGTVTGIAEGTAVITAAAGDKSAECRVRVTDNYEEEYSNVPGNDADDTFEDGKTDEHDAENSTSENSTSENGAKENEESDAHSEDTDTSDASVNALSAVITEDIIYYTGSAIKPVVKVYADGRLLNEGYDYKIKYKNNKKASADVNGDALLGVTKKPCVIITGKGNYKGKINLTLEFAIRQKQISDPDVAYCEAAVTDVSKAVPLMSYKGKRLKKNRDFTYSLSGNVLSVSGTGNYCGKLEIPVNTVSSKADIGRLKVSVESSSYSYNGKAHDASADNIIKVTDAKGNALQAGKDYVIVLTDNVAAGKMTVTVAGRGNMKGLITKKIKIAPAKISATMELSENTYTYTAGGIWPEPVVKNAGTVLAKGVDYKLKYSHNKKTGTASVKALFIGNYKGSPAVSNNYEIK